MKKLNENIDLIDFIVSEERKKTEAEEAQINENLFLLTETNLFKENDPAGLLNREKVKVIFKYPAVILMGYKQFFKILNERQKLNTSAFPITNNNGEKYYYISNYSKNGSTGFKLMWFEGLDELIQGYLWGLYSFNIDFEKLYHEVNK